MAVIRERFRGAVTVREWQKLNTRKPTEAAKKETVVRTITRRPRINHRTARGRRCFFGDGRLSCGLVSLGVVLVTIRPCTATAR